MKLTKSNMRHWTGVIRIVGPIVGQSVTQPTRQQTNVLNITST